MKFSYFSRATARGCENVCASHSVQTLVVVVGAGAVGAVADGGEMVGRRGGAGHSPPHGGAAGPSGRARTTPCGCWAIPASDPRLAVSEQGAVRPSKDGGGERPPALSRWVVGGTWAKQTPKTQEGSHRHDPKALRDESLYINLWRLILTKIIFKKRENRILGLISHGAPVNPGLGQGA